MSEKVVVSRSKLVSVADAIRSKTETTEVLTLDEMSVAIGGIDNYATAIIDRTISGEYVNNTVKNIGTQVFRGCEKLTSVSFPNVTSVLSSAFYDCTRLESFYLPKVVSLSSRAFELCSSLKSVYLPKVNSLSTYVFQDCSSLEKVELTFVTSLSTSVFNGCSKLDCLIIRLSKVCSLNNTNALVDTPIENGTGFVYVPKSLVDSYKIATNWTIYANQIRAIEDYPDITGG